MTRRIFRIRLRVETMSLDRRVVIKDFSQFFNAVEVMPLPKETTISGCALEQWRSISYTNEHPRNVRIELCEKAQYAGVNRSIRLRPSSIRL